MLKIRKLKKQLLQEEKRRKRNNSLLWRRLRLWVPVLVLLAAVAGGVYLANRDKIVAYRMARSEALLEAGDYQAAVDSLQRLQQDYPGFALAPQALFRAGEILELQLKNDQEALLAYLLVVRDYPQTSWALEAQLRAAGIYKNRLHDFNQALALLQKVADSGAPGADRVQYEVADTYFRLNNFEQARIEFESLIKNFPQSPLLPEVQYRIAVTHSLEGNLSGAADAYTKVFQNWPDSRFAVEARFRLAAVLEEQHELHRALQVLRDLQGHYPNPEALKLRINRVEERIRKKRLAF